MTAVPLARRYTGIQFTGDNSAEIVAAFHELNAHNPTITAAASNVTGEGFDLDFFDHGTLFQSQRVALDDWYVADWNTCQVGVWPPEQMAVRYFTYDQVMPQALP